MIQRIKNRFQFYLERMILRGVKYQLLFIAILIILVSVVAGTIVFVKLGDVHQRGTGGRPSVSK